MECSLVMFKSDGTRKDIPLVGARSVIGRLSTCEVRIPINSVSREHCELVCDGKTLKYRDLNSSNGIIHNGAKSKQGTLKAGDEVVIGPVVFTVMIDGKPAKITPIRTILDESDDLRAAKGEGPGGSKSGTMVKDALEDHGFEPVAAVPVPPLPSREIGSSGDHVEALKADSDFEEFNTTNRKSGIRPAVPQMPAPIGDDEDDVMMAEPADDSNPAAPAPAAAKAKSAEKPAAAAAASAKPAGKKDAGSADDDFEFIGDDHGGDDGEEPAFTFD